MKVITPVALHDLNAESGRGLVVVDVREPQEHAALRAPIGFNHPLSLLVEGDFGPLAGLDPAQPVFVVCRSGARSAKACGLLEARGFTNVTNVAGGMMAWEAAGLPIRRATP